MKILRQTALELDSIASKSWVIAPGSSSLSHPATFLPNQLERVTGTAYTPDPEKEMAGGVPTDHAPTRGFLVKDAWLLDGSLYKNGHKSYLQVRTSRFPQFHVDTEIDRAAVYSTDDGFGFFGLWLTDDCTKYLLTENEGLPIYSDAQSSQHTIDYEKLLEMKPLRLRNAYLKEAILFNDYGQNLHKKERFRKISNKILHNVNAQRHPGVFILRRNSGKRRTMHNELEMAEHLHRSRGFRILDITVADVPTIISTCAGAQVVAGIEGSHLVHGIMVLQPGCSVLTLQPPNRFCSVIKRTTDRDGQNFGFVVGRAEKDGFWVDADEVERTLDLFPKTKDITR